MPGVGDLELCPGHAHLTETTTRLRLARSRRRHLKNLGCDQARLEVPPDGRLTSPQGKTSLTEEMQKLEIPRKGRERGLVVATSARLMTFVLVELLIGKRYLSGFIGVLYSAMFVKNSQWWCNQIHYICRVSTLTLMVTLTQPCITNVPGTRG